MYFQCEGRDSPIMRMASGRGQGETPERGGSHGQEMSSWRLLLLVLSFAVLTWVHLIWAVCTILYSNVAHCQMMSNIMVFSIGTGWPVQEFSRATILFIQYLSTFTHTQEKNETWLLANYDQTSQDHGHHGHTMWADWPLSVLSANVLFSKRPRDELMRRHWRFPSVASYCVLTPLSISEARQYLQWLHQS